MGAAESRLNGQMKCDIRELEHVVLSCKDVAELAPTLRLAATALNTPPSNKVEALERQVAELQKLITHELAGSGGPPSGEIQITAKSTRSTTNFEAQLEALVD